MNESQPSNEPSSLDDRPHQSRRHDSPDDSVRASDTSHVNINRILLQLSEKALPIIALILASVAIGVLILMPAYIDARVKAESAEALVIAKVARTDARVALDDVQRVREAVNAKGFNAQKEH